MNAVRKPRRRRAAIIIRRRKPRRHVWRGRPDRAWADAMLDVRTFGWLSRRLGRVYIDELARRSRRRLGELRR